MRPPVKERQFELVRRIVRKCKTCSKITQLSTTFCNETCQKLFTENKKKERLVNIALKEDKRRKRKFRKGKSRQPEYSKVRKWEKKASSGDGFYGSRQWLELRFLALNTYGRRCMSCKCKKGPFHVDHIKPRSRYPNLSLCLTNLQILCEACNIGKSNIYETELRTPFGEGQRRIQV